MSINNAFIQSYGTTHIHIDGMTLTPRSTTDWHWTNSGNRISFPIPWQPGQPDFHKNNEYCFSFIAGQDFFAQGFNDIECKDYIAPFVCQRLDSFIPVRTN